MKRMIVSQYIPDITERFPEGMDGVDMTDSYFPSERRYSGYEDYIEPEDEWRGSDEPDEADQLEDEPYVFEVGKTYSYESLYGGTVYNRCVSRTDDTATFAESDWVAWSDGVDERKPETYPISCDENGDEECLVYHDDHYDYDAKIRANTPDGYNNLRYKY